MIVSIRIKKIRQYFDIFHEKISTYFVFWFIFRIKLIVIKNVIQIRKRIYYLIFTLGAGGKLIQSISDDCGGVAIKFPPSEAQSDKVTIRGPKEDVEKAKKMLMELSNERQLNSVSGKLKIILVIFINFCVCIFIRALRG